jgi:hypothetical protein
MSQTPPVSASLDELIAAVRQHTRKLYPTDPAAHLAVTLRSGRAVALPIPDEVVPVEQVSHSADYRSITWYGKRYTFSVTQAAIVRALWEAWESGHPEVSNQALLEAAESESAKPQDLFREHPAITDGVIGRAGRGVWRLYEPE